MSSLAALIVAIEGAVHQGSGDGRARTLSRVVDLFVASASGFGSEQTDLFDAVIQRFAVTIETRARVDLAKRLAPIPNGPRGVIGWLARDEIAVARHVLAHSTQLSDQDLMSVALDRGRGHMLAICRRKTLSPPVTDLLVSKGDSDVRHAVAGNQGARFSTATMAFLLELARLDDALHQMLDERGDLDPVARLRLVEMAKERARRRLAEDLPGYEVGVAETVEKGVLQFRSSARAPAYAVALSAIQTHLGGRNLLEADIATFADRGQRDETIVALMLLTNLSSAALERVFEGSDNNLIVVVGKAYGWSWRTIRALLRLQDPSLAERHHFRAAEAAFDALPIATAQRVVRFLKVRETPRSGLTPSGLAAAVRPAKAGAVGRGSPTRSEDRPSPG